MDAFIRFTKEAFSLLGVAVGMVVLRTGWRWRSVGGIRNLKADDYLMWVALVSLSLFFSILSMVFPACSCHVFLHTLNRPYR